MLSSIAAAALLLAGGSVPTLAQTLAEKSAPPSAGPSPGAGAGLPGKSGPDAQAPEAKAPEAKAPAAGNSQGRDTSPSGKAVAKAHTQPDSPAARSKLLDDLYAHLATAEDATQAQPIMTAIERLWLYSGSDTVSVLMDRAHAAIAAKRYDLALKLLDAVVEQAPDFAEGWNRRAYVYFAENDYQRALGDLRRVLALEPNHFKAIDGLGQILKEIGQKKAALKAFKEVLQINPNFPGAHQAVEELQREVEGQGI